jgi:TatD DNase family protein
LNNFFFESHAHYDDRRFDADRYEILSGLPAQGVTRVVNVGSDILSSKASVKLAEAFSFVYATAGVHPHDVKALSEEGLQELKSFCAHEKVVAVGEIGLDFHYEHSPRDEQRFWFKRQLELAAEVGLPVVIHSRDAASETFETIKKGPVHRGVVHSYSGGVPMALAYIDMGFYIGIGGVVTFDKSKRLPQVVAAIPLEKILIETDAPYLTPKPHRGKRNESVYLPYIIETIAEIKGVTAEAVAKQTAENGRRVFIQLG